ncbi:hypothetical protein HDV05_003633 [Chytridiales sp. JEL 0842]|nr:hypothetical protein HDV05_003633 [Chytridiales sp. JEL 0842]
MPSAELMAPTTTTTSMKGMKPTATPAAASTLSFYWDLASIDPAVRLRAAVLLINALQTLQKDHDAQLKASEESEIPDDDDIDARCPQDVAYGLRRLLRGLPSSRDGARQGFALALTELLSMLTFLKVKTVLELLQSFTEITKGMKGQEEREMYFGRIFGIRAICESGMLDRATTTTEDLDKIVNMLAEYGKAKAYLIEACFDILLSTTKRILTTPKHPLAKHMVELIKQVLPDGITSPEELWFVVALQASPALKDKIQWKMILSSWKKPNTLLHLSHKVELANILKDSAHTNPRLHSIWDTVITAVTSKDSTLSVQDFWTTFVDEAMFTSSHDRKYVGFLVFQKILPLLEPEQMVHVFSSNFMRCLINNLSTPDNFLHKAAKSAAKDIAAVATTNKDVSLQIVLQLIGQHCSHRFDKITRTKTVETVLSSLNAAQVLDYVSYLSNQFVDQSSNIALLGDSLKEIDAHRIWVTDQMLQLVRNSKIPKDEGWLLLIAKFLCFNALFATDEQSKAVGDIKPPQPPLSPAVREHCKSKFFSVLAELNSLVLTGEKGKLAPGLMISGDFWASSILSYVLDLEKASKKAGIKLLVPLEPGTIEARNQAMSTVRKFREKINSDSQGTVGAQYKAFELLFLHVLLQVYTEPTEALGVLNELQSCSKLVFGDKPIIAGLSKKRKAEEDEDEDEEEPHPIDVIVDILLSFLAKPSVLLRGITEHVFKVFSSQMTPNALDLIFEILTAKNGVAGAQELFEDDDEVEMEVDETGEDSTSESKTEEVSDDEDEDEDEDDIELDDEEDSDVDDEFRKKIEAAVGKHVAGPEEEADENSDEEEFLNDDEMVDFDDKLAAIFRERKNLKIEKRDSKQQVLHFKLRVVDLLDIFARKQSANPLILHCIVPSLTLVFNTVGSTDSPELHQKVLGFVKNKLAKIKENPAISKEEGLKVLEDIHQMAHKAANGSMVDLCSSLSLLVVRMLTYHYPECALPTETEVVPTKKSKKSKNDSSSQKPASTRTPSAIAKIYESSLETFIAGKKSRVHTSFFLDLANRYAGVAAEMISPALGMIVSGAAENGYKILQVFQFVSHIVNRYSSKDMDALKALLKQIVPLYSQSIIWILKQSNNEKVELKGLSAARMKDIKKATMAIARRCAKCFEEDELKKMWATDKISTLDGKKYFENLLQ